MHIHDPELIQINNQHWDLDIHDGSFAYMNNFHKLCLIQTLIPLLYDTNNNPRWDFVSLWFNSWSLYPISSFRFYSYFSSIFWCPHDHYHVGTIHSIRWCHNTNGAQRVSLHRREDQYPNLELSKFSYKLCDIPIGHNYHLLYGLCLIIIKVYFSSIRVLDIVMV
jgi:hypothetical protein